MTHDTQRQVSRHIARNISWLGADRMLALLCNTAIGIAMARMLGPSVFGSYSFAIAFVTILTTIASLGIDPLVLRDLLRQPTDAPHILGTFVGLRFLIGAVGGGVGGIGIWTLRGDQPDVAWLVCLCLLSLVFRPYEAIDLWFQAQMRVRPPIVARNRVLLLSTILRAGALLAGAPLLVFGLLFTLEVALTAAALGWLARCEAGLLHSWRVCQSYAGQLVREGWPLMLGGIAVMVYTRVDQILLGEILGDEAVGLFAIATRFSELGYFVPMVLMTSFTPLLIAAYQEERARAVALMQRLFTLMTALGVAGALMLTLLAPWLVRGVFGAAYEGAIMILMLHAWSMPFVFLGVAQSSWDLLEQRTRLGLLRTIIGAVLNIALNLVLIPRYAGAGAAIAILLAQVSAAWLLNLAIPANRAVFWQQTRALLFRDTLQTLAFAWRTLR